MEHKHCACCNQTKSVDDFYWQRGKPSHPCKECKKAKLKANRTPACNRKWDLKKKYGITADDYDLMFSEQNGSCAICGSNKMPTGKLYFAVDHNHETGKVRGLLCNNCNLMLGHAKDNVQTLQKAIDYLNDHCPI